MEMKIPFSAHNCFQKSHPAARTMKGLSRARGRRMQNNFHNFNYTGYPYWAAGYPPDYAQVARMPRPRVPYGYGQPQPRPHQHRNHFFYAEQDHQPNQKPPYGPERGSGDGAKAPGVSGSGPRRDEAAGGRGRVREAGSRGRSKDRGGGSGSSRDVSRSRSPRGNAIYEKKEENWRKKFNEKKNINDPPVGQELKQKSKQSASSPKKKITSPAAAASPSKKVAKKNSATSFKVDSVKMSEIKDAKMSENECDDNVKALKDDLAKLNKRELRDLINNSSNAKPSTRNRLQALIKV